jgi:carbon-monoxide dehydrogenase small subunit
VIHELELTVNGMAVRQAVESRLLLVDFLRSGMSLTGTHVGCDTSNCGSCTVLVDGDPVKSCTVLAVQVEGTEVTTIEGLGRPGSLHPVQEGFRQEHGLQCGFCTPGMVMTAVALLSENPNPTDDDVRRALEGNMCRCTGYEMIVRSVRWAAEHPEARAE